MLSIKESKFKNVDFLYKEGSKDILCCFFLPHRMTDINQNNKLLKLFLDREENFLFFFDILPDKGEYYIDKDFNYVKTITEIIKNHQKSKIFFFGSSKGATGALLSYGFFNKGELIINASQFDIGKFLLERNLNEIIEKN
jgi:hypothetical protein